MRRCQTWSNPSSAEANPDKVDGLINFQKQIMISKVIEGM